MGKALKDESGNSLVELIMVMSLFILLGVTIFTMIAAGGKAQERIISNKNAQVDARIAMSYLNVKLRQTGGAVRVMPMPGIDGNALLLETCAGDYGYDTWIFFLDGSIREIICGAGDEPAPEFGVPVVSVLDYAVSYDADRRCVTNSITYAMGDNEKTMESTVNIRVGGDKP